MNLLLLEPEEVDPTGQATVTGRRAEHIERVLRAEPGAELRVGVVDGPRGTGRVLDVSPGRVRLACTLTETVSRPDDVLLLAVPRPRVLLRSLEHATALGFGTIVLMRTNRVERSLLSSSALAHGTLRQHAVLGLEQSRRTHLPRVELAERFRPLVEDRLDALAAPTNRFVAHPDAVTSTEHARVIRGPLTLAIGPEGGFVPFELDLLASRGFESVSAGPVPYRVEQALSVLAGQLQLLRALRV